MVVLVVSGSGARMVVSVKQQYQCLRLVENRVCAYLCACESVYACVWTQKRLCMRLCMHVCMHVYFHGLHLMLKGYMENTGCKGDSNAEKLDTGVAMKHSQSINKN